ncbi:MAG TPA: ATP-dependent Clp protease ATP-binding subunit [Polyangiaceae bacterium]|nr:ATP-dependent Clp protease ATP-binding subunit [Polyangiaceae bacterium]
MSSRRIEPELVDLRKLAESLAQERKERLSSAHLLAAIAATKSPAQAILLERRVTSEEVLRAARATTGDLQDPIRSMVQKARAMSARMGATETHAIHLLLALVGERRARSFRTLEALGTDVGRLRTACMNLGLGISVPRRDVAKFVDVRQAAAGVARSVVQPKPTPAAAAKPTPSANKLPSGELVPDPTCPMASARAQPGSKPGRKVLAAERARSVVSAKKPAVAKGEPVAERFSLDPQRFPTLVGLGINLTELAARQMLEPVVGREGEVEQILDVLAKRHGNNPLLVGRAGVGKTSVLRALAHHIVGERQSSGPDDRIVIEIPTGELLAGTGVRGALSSRMGAIRKEVAQSAGRIVLFFDEIHQLFGEASEEITGELKVALQKGELPCIGTTTAEDLKRVLDTDPALMRRFTLLEVDEPSREDAYLILEALSAGLSKHHGVQYETEALALSVAWSIRYLPGRALPDKAVHVIDLAGARCRRRAVSSVDANVVAEIVAEAADMPVERLLESDAERLLGLERIVAERVVGHGGAVTRIAAILRRNAAGMGARRPIGTFLLLGPTGVGKTEMAKAVAEVLFHSESAMTRLDLSEYSEAHAVARLIGAPPGYIGHETGGLLTEAVRKRPYQVLLLDEIEKAHQDVLEAFLGVFDEGRMTDGRGRTVDFTNTVIFMTSNIGAGEAGGGRRRVGFGAEDANADVDDLERRMVAAARTALTPELYNRIDEVLAFAPLARAEVVEIARRLLAHLDQSLLERRGVRVEVDDTAVEFLLASGGYDPTLGARPLKRTILRLIEAPLAEKILRGELCAGSAALVSVEDGQLSIDVIDGDADATAAE